LATFFTFVLDNISLEEVVLFEPSRSQIILQDRGTYYIQLGRFRRYRLDAGAYEGLFVSVPEEDAAAFDASVRALLALEATPIQAAQTMAARWRALSPLQHGRRTYVLNEEANRVIIVDTWPDDSVLACTVTPMVSQSPVKEPTPHTPPTSSQGDILEVPETVARSGVPEAAAEVVSAQRCPVGKEEAPRTALGDLESAPRPNCNYR